MSDVMTKLGKRAANTGSSSRQVLNDLYSTRDQAGVAKILGVSQQTISEALRKLQIKSRTRRTPAPKGLVAAILTRRGRTTNQSARQLFKSLYSRQGKSLQEIADSLNVSLNSVYRFAVERGINLRRVGRPSGKTRTRRSNADLYTGCL